MSISDIILFPHIPESIYDNRKKANVTNLVSLGKELEKLFKNAQNKDKLSQLILFDFYLSIHHQTIVKDNITGKRIEQRLSKLFALSTGDELRKKSPKIETLLSKEEISLFEKDVLALIASNYREKGDLFFYDGGQNTIYKLSIKSLVPTNTEINFGAFEFQSTIKGIKGLEELENLQERSRKITLEINNEIVDGAGLGSSKQMSKIIDFLKDKNKLKEYLERFRILLSGVYKDDFLIYIKSNSAFNIYLVENATFIDIILQKVESNFKNMRIESNSIRVTDLKLFRERAYKKFEFEFETVIPDFNTIEALLIKSDHEKTVALRDFINS